MRTILLLQITCLGFIVLFVQSCVFNPFNYTYIQTPVNVPSLEKQGDLRTDAYVWINHADFQASYAPKNHWGIMGEYNQGYKNSIHYGELGTGYFSSPEHRLVFSSYLGAGLGDLGVGYTDSTSLYTYIFDLNSHYTKLFLQPSLAIHLSSHILLTTTLRVNYVLFQSYSYRLDKESYDTVSVYHIETSSPEHVWIFDPSTTFTFNVSRHLSLMATANVSFTANSSDHFKEGDSPPITIFYDPTKYNTNKKIATHPVYSHLAIHLGIRYRMNTAKKKPSS